VINSIKGRYPDAEQLLKSFNGRLAKWRYETLYVVFHELLPLRFICENFLCDPAAIFGDKFQDGPLLADVKTACNFPDLWIFIKVFYYKVLEPLEKARRWGLVCRCCKHLRGASPNKKIICVQASRRLPEVRAFVYTLHLKLVSDGGSLTIDYCEGKAWIQQEVSFSLRTTGLQLRTKGKFMDVVPFRLSEAESPEHATACAQQLRNLDLAKCTPLERRYHDELLPELDVRDKYNS
jgi:hypothetical protein